MIVTKFGGSSLESAGRIEQAGSIVKQHLNRNPVVIVSAMGKTTDRLQEAVRCAARGDSYSAGQQYEVLRRMHCNETRVLLGQRAEPFLRDTILPLFHELQALLAALIDGRQFTPEIQDEALSHGERISSLIVAEAFRHMGINAAQVDARKVIVTGDQFTHAQPLYWDTYARLRRTVALVARDRVVVMGGFIGATREGVTTTLGRGGSDLSASLVGAGISADEIQIWTDVDGMLTCDPRMLTGGHRLREITYQEAQEMARFGAKVLHPAAIAPVLRQRIPMVIRNSYRPEGEGTRLVPRLENEPGIVKCLTSKKGMAVVRMRVRNQGMLSSITDGLAGLFASSHISVDLIETDAQGISFAVENWHGLPEVLRQVDAAVHIRVEEDRAAVWLVGEGIAQVPATLARAQAALRGMEVRLTSQGSSSLSLGFAIRETDLPAAMEALHREFFAAPDTRIFAAPEPAAWHAPQAAARVRPAGRPQPAIAH
ncbi:MAG TPA: aspartate kinase [Bryobacteraceae bacterium]|nr:aspartate kinase [Bryobacteraceae bacterium]